jgi:hypothetical protein
MGMDIFIQTMDLKNRFFSTRNSRQDIFVISIHRASQKFPLISIIGAFEAEKDQKTKWVLFFETPCISRLYQNLSFLYYPVLTKFA